MDSKLSPMMMSVQRQDTNSASVRFGLNFEQDNKSQAGQQQKLPVYVQKWIDYSTKFGLGFQLSDKVNGVYFNDRTIMF